jgi:lysophospholipase L1-like esterase
VSTATIAVVALVAAVLAGVGGYWWGRSRPVERHPLTVVVGDSVTAESWGEVVAALTAPGQPADVVVPAARIGLTTAEAVPLVREAVAGVGDDRLDRVVVLVGYNDVRLGSVATSALEALGALAGRFRCGVVLTLPRVAGPGWGLDDLVVARRVERWNRRLAALVAATPRLRLSRAWQEAVEGRGGLGLLGDDRLHPNAAGRARLAEVEAQALADAC